MGFKIPLRAEDADRQFIEHVKKHTVDRGAPAAIIDILNDSDVVEVLAPKGVGKTLSVYVTLNVLWEEKKVHSSGIYFDPETGKISVIDSKKYCDDESFTSLPPKKQVEEAEVLVVDNWHYVADVVLEGYLHEKFADTLARATVDEIESGKRVLIVTESPITHYYALGMNGRSVKELVDYVSDPMKRVEVFPPSLSTLANIYRVYVDKEVRALWEKYSDGTPRTFANMVNALGREITYEKLREWVFRKLSDKVGRKYGSKIPKTIKKAYEFVRQNPVFPKDFKQILDELSFVMKYLSGKVKKDELILELEQVEEEEKWLRETEAVKKLFNLRKEMNRARRSGDLMRVAGLLVMQRSVEAEPLVKRYLSIGGIKASIRRRINLIDLVESFRSRYFRGCTKRELIEILNRLEKCYVDGVYVGGLAEMLNEFDISKAFEELNCGSYYMDLLTKTLEEDAKIVKLK